MIVATIATVCYFNFSRHFVAGSLDSDGMDLVQSARLLGRTGKFSTNIVRPLLTANLSVNGDGTAPDFAHAPLFSMLVAAVTRATHQTGAGQGAREAMLASVALYALCLGATAVLARHLFGGQPIGSWVTVLGVLFFGMAGTAPAQSLQAHPTMLCALLFTTLVWCLLRLDMRGNGEETAAALPPVSLRMSSLAGILFGLLFLSLYSALILLPLLVFHLYRINRGGRRAMASIGMFLLLALMVAGPLLARNERLAHNPLYNARLADLVENTDTNPGYSLLGMAVPPRSLSQYLSNGGAIEIAGKMGRNLTGYYADAPVIIGLFVLPLFLLAALTRFRDARVNRLRNLVYACIALHTLGLSPFQPFSEDAPLLLMYAPVAAIIAAAFLLSVIQTRNLPSFYANGAVIAWTAFACLPGIGEVIAPPTFAAKEPPYKVYDYLNTTSSDMVTLRAGRAYMMSDAPWEAAYRLDVPVIWLPTDAADMEMLTERTGRPIGAVLLTPAIGRRSAHDPAVGLWVSTYKQILAVVQVAAGLDTRLAKSVVERSRLFYPDRLTAGMTGFRPEQVPEQESSEFSLLFWNSDAMTARKPVPAQQIPDQLLITP